MASIVVPMDTARAKARPSVAPWLLFDEAPVVALAFARGLALAFPISLLFWAVVALALILAF